MLLDLSTSGWDDFLFGIPLIVLLFAGYFRLDEIFSSSRKSGAAPRPREFPSAEKHLMQSDPDGRPWKKPNS